MRVLFVSSGGKENKISPIVKSQGESLIHNGIDIDYFIINGNGVSSYLKAVKELKGKLKGSDEFVVIHAHYGLSALVAYFCKKGTPLIVSFMGDDLIGSKDYNGNIKLFSKFLVRLNRFFAKNYYDYSIVKSKQMFELLNVRNSSVISNGVDMDRFYEIESLRPLNSKVKKVLFCSDPKRSEKNYKLAKKSIEIITKYDIDFECIYGVEQRELVKYYNSADCILLTSFHEGSPNVIKEAMACSVPIVSTDVGDVRDLIKNTKGCYIAGFDPEEIADKIVKAVTFDRKTSGRKDICYLDSNIVAKNIIEIYKMIIG